MLEQFTASPTVMATALFMIPDVLAMSKHSLGLGYVSTTTLGLGYMSRMRVLGGTRTRTSGRHAT